MLLVQALMFAEFEKFNIKLFYTFNNKKNI